MQTIIFGFPHTENRHKAITNSNNGMIAGSDFNLICSEKSDFMSCLFLLSIEVSEKENKGVKLSSYRSYHIDCWVG